MQLCALESEAQLDYFQEHKDEESLKRLIACVGEDSVKELLKILFTEEEINEIMQNLFS